MTLRELRTLYTQFRRRYFAGDGLPLAAELKFRWAGEEDFLSLKTELACTLWPPGGKQELVFHPFLKGPWFYRLSILVLLHEMAHLKNPKADHGPWFHQEATRLGSLGAMREFFC